MTLRKWATTTNYTTGVDTGTPTCVDPGAGVAAEGFVPHEGVPAQHVNSLFHDVIQALFDPRESPEAYAEIRDDFIGCTFDSATNILHSVYPWEVTSTENAVPSTDPPLGVGTVTASLLATEEFEMELAGQQLSIPWGALEEATFRVKLTLSDFTDAEFFVGLAENFELVGVGSNAVGLWFDYSVNNAQWLIRNKVGGVDDAVVTGTFLGSDVWVSLKLRRISATQVEVYLFGDLQATLTDGVDAPADAAEMTVGMFAKAGSAAAMTPHWDLCYVRWTTPNRAT
jgi:hypothetical protein